MHQSACRTGRCSPQCAEPFVLPHGQRGPKLTFALLAWRARRRAWKVRWANSRKAFEIAWFWGKDGMPQNARSRPLWGVVDNLAKESSDRHEAI